MIATIISMLILMNFLIILAYLSSSNHFGGKDD